MYTKQRVKQIITSSYETISAIKKDNPPFYFHIVIPRKF